ncbi:MAG: mercuric reductase [Longimicrobiales bacterium]|nr:mercuric reductase [Longimicrobiales bacterium]
MKEFDAIVIGTGQGGKPLAGALARRGQRVAVIEKAPRVGGTCVIDGCTPTKTMIASARVAHLARRAADFGVEVGEVEVDLARVRERKRSMVDAWSGGSRRGLEKWDTLDLIFGHARFTGPHEIEVELSEGGMEALRAPSIFINTGTHNFVPPIDGLDEVAWLDNASLMELGEVPRHLIILGGGFLGMEFGQMFRRFGAEVTVVEAAPRILGREDEDVAEGVCEILEGEGVRILTGTRAVGVEPDGSAVAVRAEGPGGELRIEGSHLMVAVGRRPSTADLGVETAGIELTERGFVKVDDELRTSVDGVWALGDVNGGPPFTHTSYDDYRIVERNLFGDGKGTRAGRIVPFTMFIDPQLGRVGLTEAAAREAGHEVRVARIPMSRVARAVEADETRGFMKAVVDAETDRILGAAILGIEGGEVATVIQVAMMGNLPWTTLRDATIAHPTLSESLNNLFMTLD